MALNLEQKKAVVAEVTEVASSALSVVAAEYRGLESNELNDLRSSARKENVHIQVIKNSLAKRALAGSNFECMSDSLVGPLMLAFSIEDPGAAARVIEEFAKEHEALSAKVLSIGGEVLDGSQLSTVAKLPTRDQALGILAGVIRAPVEKLVRTMAEPTAQTVRAIAAVKDQKEAA